MIVQRTVQPARSAAGPESRAVSGDPSTRGWESSPYAGGERVAALIAALDQRVLVLDGAMGTLLQSKDLKAADFGGAEYEGCNEHLVLTRPDLIEQIHVDYFTAGADITETNTFGSTPLVLGEYGLADKAHQINLRAAQL